MGGGSVVMANVTDRTMNQPERRRVRREVAAPSATRRLCRAAVTLDGTYALPD